MFSDALKPPAATPGTPVAPQAALASAALVGVEAARATFHPTRLRLSSGYHYIGGLLLIFAGISEQPLRYDVVLLLRFRYDPHRAGSHEKRDSEKRGHAHRHIFRVSTKREKST